MLQELLAESSFSVSVAVAPVARGLHLALQQIRCLSFAPWKNQGPADVQAVRLLGDTLRE
jgi:hypothetical protein